MDLVMKVLAALTIWENLNKVIEELSGSSTNILYPNQLQQQGTQ